VSLAGACPDSSSVTRAALLIADDDNRPGSHPLACVAGRGNKMRRVLTLPLPPTGGRIASPVATERRLLRLTGIALPGAGKRLARPFAAPDAPAESRRQPAGVAGQGDKVGGGLWDSTPPVALRRLCSTTRVRAIPRPLWSRSDALIAHHQKLHREPDAKRCRRWTASAYARSVAAA
jgi:hypothetical protein